MLHTLGPIAYHGLLAAAGAGILCIAGVRPSSPGRLLVMVGLAYLVGLSAVFGVVIALLVAGVPFTLATVFLVSAAFAVPAVPHIPSALSTARRWLVDHPRLLVSFPVIAGVVLAGVWVVALLTLSTRPLTGWDAWAIWGYKAEIFTSVSHIPAATFHSDADLFTHFDYPLGVPLWEAAHFRSIGAMDTSQVASIDWLLLPAWIGGVVTLAPRTAPMRLVLPLTTAMGLLLIPQLVAGYADVPMAMLLSLAVLAFGRWVMHRGRADLVLAVVLLGGASLMKNEGIIGGVGVVVALVAAVARDRTARRPAVIAAGAWALVFVAPWKLWLAAHDIKGDLPMSRMVNPSFLWHHADRLKMIGQFTLNTVLAGDVTSVGVIALVALIVVRGPARRLRVFVTAAFGLYLLSLVLAYWVTPWDLGWHLANSITRVLVGSSMIGVAGILLVSEPAEATDPPNGTRIPVAGGREREGWSTEVGASKVAV